MVQLEATIEVDVWYYVYRDREENEAATNQTRETYQYDREFDDHPNVDGYIPTYNEQAPEWILDRMNLPAAAFDEDIADYDIVDYEITLYGNTDEWRRVAEAMARERDEDVVGVLRMLAEYDEVSGAGRAADELAARR